MRIAVYSIALNEIRHVARFLAGVADADLVVVADTGSTDGTAEALAAGGAAVHAIRIRPWRFDDARNAALALVPADVDVCFALDLDETLSPGWRVALEAAWRPGTTQALYRHVAAHREDGSPAVEMLGTHVHARFGYRWRHPVHEMLVADRITPRTVRVAGLRLDHWPDAGKSRSQYLPLLEAAAAEDPREPRHLFLLGREYVFLKRWAEGEAALHRFLALPAARAKDRRAAAMRRIARCRLALDDADGAATWLARALAEKPEDRDCLVDLADLHRRRGEWDACLAIATRALAVPLVPGRLANDWRSTGALPHDLAALAAFRLGRRDDALRHAEAALAAEPWDKRLRGNLASLRRWAAGGPEAPPAGAGAGDRN